MPNDTLLTSAEVAGRFGVTEQTVRIWAKTKKLDSIRTPGGQVRFRQAYIESLLTPTEPEGGAS